MKDASIGDYLLWKGRPGKIIAETDQRQVIIEMIEDHKCSHCGGSLGHRHVHVIVSSPLFQNWAKKLPTIVDEDNIIIN